MSTSKIHYFKEGGWWPADVIHQPIQENLTGWFDAADTSTITASGSAVSQWDNKGSVSVNLTQATGAAQPFTGTRTQNGLNVLDFQGAQWLEGGDNFDLSTTDFTTLGVVKADTTSNMTYWGKSQLSGAGDRWSLLKDGNLGFLLDGFKAVADTRTTPRTFGAWFRRVFSPGLQVLIDGRPPTNATNVNTNNTANFNSSYVFGVGAYQNASGNFNPPAANLYLDGFIAEICIWNRALQLWELDQMHRYFRYKWGVTF